METIRYINRATGTVEEEKVYGARALNLAYGNAFFSPLLRFLAGRLPAVSALYGFWQKRAWTKKKIAPFVKEYGVDLNAFESASFNSFNDFFTRKLKPGVRPIAKEEAIIPADGRYQFFPRFDKESALFVKGQALSLSALLQDAAMAEKYSGGTLVFGRLCPSDYHRFHFPCNCTPAQAKLINGYLYSVNPIALKRNISILSENKRMVTELDTEAFGQVLFIEVGATNVGCVIETYKPNQEYKKGEEKGFFSFGGSAIVMLFLPGAITLSEDLLGHSMELLCQFGEPLGSKG